MPTDTNRQRLFSLAAPGLEAWGRAFITAKKAEGLARTTLHSVYAPTLAAFFAFCSEHGVIEVDGIDPTLIREYLLTLSQRHNPGGVHKHYRVLKTWLRWYEVESAPDGWRNPIKRVKAPRLPERILDPAPLADIGAMVKAASLRDQAILLTLLDTGLRASELLRLDVADFDQADGLLAVRHGKGSRARVVPMGATARRAVRKWLRSRPAGGVALFCMRDGLRLSYWGLRQAFVRISARAGVPTPSPHSIRRAFALGMLRAGVDLLTLSRLMGHSGLSLLARYAKQSTGDLRAAVERASLADRL